MAPEFRVGTVRAGGGELQYQVIEERLDGHVVWYEDVNQHLDLGLADPSVAAFAERLGRYGLTSVRLQPRGVGLPDPTRRIPTVEEQAEDLFAVMDAEGIRRATLVGTHQMGPAVALAAAQHPGRVQGLILLSCLPAGPLVDDGAAAGWTPETARECVARYEQAIERWGEGYSLDLLDPELCSPYYRRLVGMMERCSASRGFAAAWHRRTLGFDGRGLYAQVRVPTVVLSLSGSVYPATTADALTALIPGAEHRRLPPAQLGDSLGTAWIPIGEAVASLALGTEAAAAAVDRALTTVLYTDIVDSTGHVVRLGDAAWEELLDTHDRVVRREATRAGGRVVSAEGDGTLSELPGPAAAVRCAQAVGDALAPSGLRIRAGVHTGECLRRGPALAGMAVHLAARVAALAEPDQVLVTDAAHDLAEGSGLVFAAPGDHELKGVPGRWTLYRVVLDTVTATEAMIRPATPRPLDRLAVTLAQRAPRLLRALARVGNARERRRARRVTAAPPQPR